MQEKNIDGVERLLAKLGKEQLCEFIRDECINNRQLMQRFLAFGAGDIFATKSADYRCRVERIIDSFEGRHGYVEYRNTFALNRAICKIIDEADEAIGKYRWDVAFAILEGVASAGEDIVSCGDDSAGELGSIIEECFSKWSELCSEESLPAEIRSKIFELSISYFTKGHLKDFDWRWNWIHMAVSLADTSQKRERIVKVLDNVISTGGDEWNVEYSRQTAQRYKLEIISKSGTPEQQREFMYENVGNPDFRQKLLQMAWDEGNYKEVLRLASEGVAHDSKLPGLVKEWRKWELKTYRHKNDKANTLKLARYFFFEEGRFGEK